MSACGFVAHDKLEWFLNVVQHDSAVTLKVLDVLSPASVPPSLSFSIFKYINCPFCNNVPETEVFFFFLLTKI